jgi:hypothetical protein
MTRRPIGGEQGRPCARLATEFFPIAHDGQIIVAGGE